MLMKEQKKYHSMHINVPIELYENLRKKIGRTYVSTSACVVELIRKYLETE